MDLHHRQRALGGLRFRPPARPASPPPTTWPSIRPPGWSTRRWIPPPPPRSRSSSATTSTPWTASPPPSPRSASVVGAPLDPASVSPATVVVQDVTDRHAGGTGAVAITTTYDVATNRFTIAADTAWHEGPHLRHRPGGRGGRADRPGRGAARRLHHLGPGALLLAAGDLSGPGRRRLQDRHLRGAASPWPQALSLERVRRGLAPVLDALDAAGHPPRGRGAAVDLPHRLPAGGDLRSRGQRHPLSQQPPAPAIPPGRIPGSTCRTPAAARCSAR